LVEALRPPALDELGLLGAVRSRATALAGELTIEVTGDEPLGPLPAAVETAGYRIMVEAIANAVRHSGGSHCLATISAHDHSLQLSVADDGNGLDPARTPGVGLRSMQERAAEVGGTLWVRSTPDGSVVSARLPLGQGGST
jgi:signal transduction histidine kinase